MVEIDSTWSDERIILVIHYHQDVSYYFGVVDCFGISLEWSESEWFCCYVGCDVDVDRNAPSQLTDRYHKMLCISCCYLSANLSDMSGRYDVDGVNGIIVDV